MSKIIISGSSIVLKSSLELTTIQKLAKYKPEALETRDEKGKLLFKIGIAGNGEGIVKPDFVYFAPVTHDEDGKATVTLLIPESVENAKDYAADLLGAAYRKLAVVEEAAATASTEVDTAKAEMLRNITVQ